MSSQSKARMATARTSLLPFFLSFSVFVFLHFHLYKANAIRLGEKMEETNHHVTRVESLLLAPTVCSDSFNKDLKGSQVALRVSHKDGPCSPLVNQRHSQSSTLDLLLQDQSRVRSLQSRISKRIKPSLNSSSSSSQDEKLPAKSGASMRTGNFIVTVGLGTPKQDFSLVFDTGSDLTWIQCQPCDPNRCYQQQDPLFDPSKSSSYSNIPCSSTECSHLRSGPRCSSSNCVYSVKYGDQSYTTGLFARETLTLGAPENVVLPGFQFGCGQNNHGLFGTTAGLLGLGRDQVSLVSQSSQKFGKIFKYCLPASRSSTGYLAFGGSGTSNTVKFTPLVTDSQEASFYFVSLEGISVGGQRLSDVTPSVFSASGTIIDSGTVITRLPPLAYTSLRDAFRQGMSKYQSAQPFSLLDTCYDLSGQDTVEVPKITLHFGGGVDVEVDQSGILVAVSESQFCLAFAGNEDASDVAIFGNKQQQTFEVVYDVGGNRLGFGPGGC